MSEFAGRLLLTPEPAAASAARRFIRESLRSWQAPAPAPVVDDAVLLASELVANAVQHAGTGIELGCRLAGEVLEVTVTDQHPARSLPDPRGFKEDFFSERGRGLTLPAALASSWGVTYTGAAKAVWFRLRLPPSAGAPPGPEPGQLLEPSPDPGPGSSLDPGSEPDYWRSAEAGRELGRLDFDELVRHTVEAARDAVGADAAYALVADEEGELRVRGAVGVAVPEALTAPPGTILLSGGGMATSEMSVPFLVDGRVTGVLGVGAASRGKFRGADERRLQRVADRVVMSLERLRLAELERVRRGRVTFLAEASELLSSTLDARQAVALTAQLMVPRLAAWCAVFLAADAGELTPAYVWHEDEARIDALGQLLSAIPPPAPAGGRETDPGGLPGAGGAHSLPVVPGAGAGRAAQSWSLAVPAGAGPEAEPMAADSAWWFPLTARGHGLGAVVIGRPRGDRRWQDPPPRESLELAEDLTRRAGLALDNARLYERQRATSRALQASLLPPELPQVPRAELAAEYEAAGEANDVGGDFYDVFGVAGGAGGDGGGGSRWRFAIGDVCGTGPEAAAVTGLARHTLRILAAEGYPLADAMRRLNELILSEGPRGRFVTLLHGEIGVPAATDPLELSLVCAGHPPPLLLRAASAARPRPAAESQLLLGVEEGVSFDTQQVRLHPGDVLLCVTDGVTERRDDDGRLLDDDDGLAGLLAGCGGLSAWAVAARIQRAVSEFGSEPPSDDMAVLVIRATGG